MRHNRQLEKLLGMSSFKTELVSVDQISDSTCKEALPYALALVGNLLDLIKFAGNDRIHFENNTEHHKDVIRLYHDAAAKAVERGEGQVAALNEKGWLFRRLVCLAGLLETKRSEKSPSYIAFVRLLEFTVLNLWV